MNLCLSFTDHYKYLGHIIANDLRDDADISGQTRLLYSRDNMLLRKFFVATESLQRSHCSLPSAALFMDVSSGMIFLKNLYVAYMMPSIMPYGFC